MRVFVLHSFAHEHRWTRGQHRGFVDALSADPARTYDLKVESLDAKRVAVTPAYARSVADHLREKYRDYRPTAVYASDDAATKFALEQLDPVFPGVPVFFSGVVKRPVAPGRGGRLRLGHSGTGHLNLIVRVDP